MNYDVTIGIPVFNAEKYLRQTLESALAQTFAGIEFLLVDDECSDGSLQIVRELQQTHPRGADIHLLHQPHNMGVGAARNRLIDEAQGRFLYFMDADDRIEPGTIALLMEHQQRTGADIVFGSYERIGEAVLDTRQYPFLEMEGEGALAAYAWRRYGAMQTTIWNYVVRIDVLRQNRLRFIDASFWEDMAFTFELLPCCRHAVLLPDITYHYQCHDDSLSNYQEREHIGKDEVQRNISTVDYMKRQCAKTSGKPFQPERCRQVLTTAFYVLCYILKHEKKIAPSFTVSELKPLMSHPATLSDILHFSHARFLHLALWLGSRLPAPVVVALVRAVGKVKGLT